MNLKHKNGNLKCKKRKNKWSKWSATEINKDLSNKGACRGWCGIVADSLDMRLAMYLFKIDISEVDASLKWMP